MYVYICFRTSYVGVSSHSVVIIRMLQNAFFCLLFVCMYVFVLFVGVKRHGRKANHSLLYSSQTKSGGAVPLLPHMSSWHSA